MSKYVEKHISKVLPTSFQGGQNFGAIFRNMYIVYPFEVCYIMWHFDESYMFSFVPATNERRECYRASFIEDD
jgi:hypothetical protein